MAGVAASIGQRGTEDSVPCIPCICLHLFAAECLAVWVVAVGLPELGALASGPAVALTTVVLVSVIGNFTSIAFPVRRPISAISSAASPVGILALIGCLVAGAVLAGAAMVVGRVSGLPALQPAICVGALGAVLVGYRVMLGRAVEALGECREGVLRRLGAS